MRREGKTKQIKALSVLSPMLLKFSTRLIAKPSRFSYHCSGTSEFAVLHFGKIRKGSSKLGSVRLDQRVEPISGTCELLR